MQGAAIIPPNPDASPSSGGHFYDSEITRNENLAQKLERELGMTTTFSY